MIDINSDSIAVAKAIAELASLLQRHGAYFDKDAEIVFRGGELSFRKKTVDKSGKLIIRMPPACLLPVGDFRLSLSGNDIYLADHDAGVSTERLEIMHRVIEVFNLTHKIERHRASSPSSFESAFPEFHARLFSGRTKSRATKPMKASQHNDPLVDSMLKSRTLSWRTDRARNR